MDEEEQLSFFLEWYDPQSEQSKPYLLHYYGDCTLELIERNSRRTFLKRIHVPTVTLKDLYIGASLSIYSRQLTVLEAANAHTKRQLQLQSVQTTLLLTPRGYPHMGRLLSLLERQGLQLVHVAMVQLHGSQLPKLRRVFPAMDQKADVTSDVSLMIEIKGGSLAVVETTVRELERSQLMEFILMSSSTEGENNQDGSHSSLVSPSSSLLPRTEWGTSTTAVLDNCTLCLIRPRLVRDGQVGQVVDEILGAGFEISALKMLHLRMEDADEFFRVYKGIYRQYQEVLKYMSSGPCVALEVRGEDVVRRFRALCGPHDVEVARALRPTSLRARLGKSNLHNAVHCTDCPEDGVMEAQFIFTALGS